jgi:hypothetical protein
VKRDPRLRELSVDHHHALVIARRAPARDAAWLREVFEAQLAPHFAVEEELLLPALARAGGADLVARTLEDHQALRALVAAGDGAAFAERLVAHVRFEERELFPACEARLAAEILEEVARATAP